MTITDLHSNKDQGPDKRRCYSRLTASRRFPAKAGVLLVLALQAGTTCAEEGADERFALALGAYNVLRYDSSASLTERNVGLGIAVSPEDVLGLDSRQTVFRLEGAWQIRPAHAVNFSWYKISSDNALNIRRDFEWIDDNGETITIPVGASLSSSLNYSIVKLGYLWSFYQSDKVELRIGGGLHVTDVTLNLGAETTSTGVNAARGDTSLPMPVLSFELVYGVNPKFDWYLKSELFTLSFGDWSGTYSDVLLGAEYRLWKKVGVGLALGGNSLQVNEENADTRFKFENRITGVTAYFRCYF